ncbi:MAG: acetate kinase [Rickettsiales bacterium]|jgi:acetate kinase|nr:acetate kinase [Rickettsiales bacterium]
MSYILALNCGSSTLKYQVFDTDSRQLVLGGNVEKIGETGSFINQKYSDGTKQKKETEIKNHLEALNLVMFMLREASIDLNEIAGVGHRVVHGGEKFASSVEITDEVIKTIEELSPLAPLHNPANLVGIVAAKQSLPNARQVAIFDTAFHQTMPDFAYRYAVPNAWYKELGVRRYGFHGTSHLYVSKRAAKMLGKPASECNLITLHIGSGASAAAIRGGRSVDTSLGLTPLSGLTMGTRPGDLDPGVILYVMEQLGLPPADMQTWLNKKSGLLGITECHNDHRDIESNIGNDACKLALNIEIHNLKKYIGSYLAELGQIDAIVFTAGVGENDNIIRAGATSGLEELGIKMDQAKNAETFVFKGAGETDLSAADSKVKILMIPTNEELVIVEDTIAIINGTYNPNHLDMDYSFAK